MIPDGASIDIETLKSIMRDHLAMEDQAKILRDLEKTLQEEAVAGIEGEQEDGETDEPLPKVKKKMVVVITTLPEDCTGNALNECAAFIAEIPEETSAREIPEMLKDIASEYRGTNKARKNPVNSVGELWVTAAAKLFKSRGLGKKSKEVVEVHFVDNKLIS